MQVRTIVSRTFPAMAIAAAMILLVLAGGCTQAGSGGQSAEQKQILEVTVTQPDANHIVTKYLGGPNMEKIMEIETSITDSSGRSVTKSIGSRLATTPITIGGTNSIEGAFAGKDHVVVTGFFNDGSRKVLLDTTV